MRSLRGDGALDEFAAAARLERIFLVAAQFAASRWKSVVRTR
jgi:hypothetical protein